MTKHFEPGAWLLVLICDLMLVIWSLVSIMDLFDAIKGRKSIRRFKQTPVPDDDIRKIIEAARQAPVVIAVFMEAYDAGTDRLFRKMGCSDEDVRRLRPLPGLQSVSAAIQNMLLAIHALGYGSCWMTGPLVAQEAFGKLLGYGKDKYIAALIPVGVPDEDPPARSRKPLKEIMKVIG